MDLREQIQERIAKLDDAVLPDLLLDLDALEARQSHEFPRDFIEMMNRAPERNTHMSSEEALKLATEEVKAHRQSRR